MNEMPMPPGATPKSKAGDRLIAAAIVIILLAIIGLIYLASRNMAATQEAGQPAIDLNSTRPSGSAGDQVGAADEIIDRVIDLNAVPFRYSLTEITVKKGERVKLNLKVIEGLHDWVVDEFNARTEQLAAGQSDSVEFTADRAGTFEYYCSVGNHRQMGMVGKLIVAE